MLFEILYSSEADATCRTLEGPFRTVESWAGGGTDVQVVWVLDILQPGEKQQEKKEERRIRRSNYTQLVVTNEEACRTFLFKKICLKYLF